MFVLGMALVISSKLLKTSEDSVATLPVFLAMSLIGVEGPPVPNTPEVGREIPRGATLDPDILSVKFLISATLFCFLWWMVMWTGPEFS